MRISIEGNIGCGKSTLLRRLRQDWTVHEEPVDEWAKLLQLFYANPRRWVFTMNSCALLATAVVPDVKGKVVIVERSPLSCKEVFSRLHRNDGTLTEKEWVALCDLYHRKGWTPDVIVYLHCPPAVCMERLRGRGRDGEQQVSMEYLSKLQFAHNTMMKWFEGVTHAVDASQSPESVLLRVQDIVKSYGK